MLIVSAVLGLSIQKTVKADPVTEPASYDYFKAVNGNNVYGTGTLMSYGDANVLYGTDRPLTTSATTKAFTVEFCNTVKQVLSWYTVPATLVFRKPIDLSVTDNLVTLGWIGDDAESTTAFGGNSFVMSSV